LTFGCARQTGRQRKALYAAFFVKPSVVSASIQAPALEKRDRFYGVATPSPASIWAVGTFGKVVRSDDDGASWQVQPTPVRVNLQSIAAWDAQAAVAVGNGAILATSDGGGSWSEKPFPRSPVANKLLRVRIAPDASAWALGEMGAILLSRDRGSTWARTGPEEDVTWADMAFPENREVLVGEFGRIKLSEDRGKSWREVSSPVKSSLTAIAFKDKSNGIAVGLEGVILATADAGKSWTALQSPIRQHLFDVIWDGDAWVAVGARGMTLKSDDGEGKTWSVVQTAEQTFGWYTQVQKKGQRYYFAGAALAVMEQGSLHVFGRDPATGKHP
jgi:photosystem II stability/assembly factor-like uncharacterized protein